MNYKTPGVYTEEVSTFPSSVAQVETAIPAFIGYTEKAIKEGPDDLLNVPTKIESLLEYEHYFGGSHVQAFNVNLADEPPFLPKSVEFAGEETPYRMHPALKMFFANGGGPCYIISVGDYKNSTPTPTLDNIEDFDELKAGLDKIRKIDEVTLIVIPEADQLQAVNQYNLYKEILAQCGELKDRFGIFDLSKNDEDAGDFRNGIGTSFLSYGAAYYPHLNTSISYRFDDKAITFSHNPTKAFDGFTLNQVKTLAAALQLKEPFTTAKQNVKNSVTTGTDGIHDIKVAQIKIALNNTQKALVLVAGALESVEDEDFSSTHFDAANAAYDTLKNENFDGYLNDPLDDALTALDGAIDELEAALPLIIAELNNQTGIGANHNANIATYFTNLFSTAVINLINEERITMPPSSTIAGIYAKVDRDRGVWKAPANVSINRVSGPSDKLTLSENDNFNVHPTGKSINVIRAFTGKGTLIWGVRTLDGNSNEWRYISVRRFFNMVEESTKKASGQFVFEPNDANTWVKVKAMIENFLTLQWRAGALMGAKPEEAFFVKIGLGETMTQLDVLEGRMIVEIGMAAVRPAEFIILRFSHKMLES